MGHMHALGVVRSKSLDGVKGRYITVQSPLLFSFPNFWYMVRKGIKMDDPVDIGLELLSTALDEITYKYMTGWMNRWV